MGSRSLHLQRPSRTWGRMLIERKAANVTVWLLVQSCRCLTESMKWRHFFGVAQREECLVSNRDRNRDREKSTIREEWENRVAFVCMKMSANWSVYYVKACVCWCVSHTYDCESRLIRVWTQHIMTRCSAPRVYVAISEAATLARNLYKQLRRYLTVFYKDVPTGFI